MTKHKTPPAPTYQAWGSLPEGEMARHPVYGPMCPAKKVLINYLLLEGWAFKANSGEWINPDTDERGRIAHTGDGMTAWMHHPGTGEERKVNGVFMPVLPPDSHRITLGTGPRPPETS